MSEGMISPHPKKFTAFIDEWVEKNKSIWSKHGGFKNLSGTCKKKIV